MRRIRNKRGKSNEEPQVKEPTYITDPVEQTEAYLNIRDELEQKIRARMKDINPFLLGRCHIYWAIKQDILWRDYGIRWRSPQELNPAIHFD